MNEMETIAPQRAASPLALSGRWLALLDEAGVTLRALDSGATRTVPIAAARGLGVLADGAFVVLSLEGPAAIRIPVEGAPQRHAGVLALDDARARVLAWPGEGAFVTASRGGEVWCHRLVDDGSLTRLGSIEVEPNGHATVTSGPGASIVYALTDELVVRDLRGREQRFALPDTSAWHLAPGPAPDLVWIATDAGELQLVRLADPARIVRSFELGGDAVHLHASGDRAAVIVGRDGDVPFTLAVFDAAGERWRAPLAETEPHAELFVASSSSHVVVLGEELAAFTRDGQRVASIVPRAHR